MKSTVLFLCTGNSARSQMAEVWLRQLSGDRFDVCSAGTHPLGMNPGSIEAMAEVGIDIAGHRSKGMGELADRSFDYVITVCDRAKETCPIWPGRTTVIHWSFDDPAAITDVELRRLTFRRVRDEIAASIRRFLKERQG